MRKFLLVLALLTMTGCSTKFIYKNADWLSYWYLDDYVSLTDEQEAQFDERLLAWLDWHKSQELTQYAQQLTMLKSDIENDKITLERIGYHREQMLEHWHRLRNKVVPDLVEMAPMLSDTQVSELFDEIAEGEAERTEKRAKRSEQKKHKRWLKERKNNLKRWIGRLSAEQEGRIEQLYEQQVSTAALWSDYRARYQGELRALFAQPERGDAFKARLSELLMAPEVYRSEQLNLANEQNSKVNHQYLLDVYQSLSAKQKKRLVSELEELIEDIQSLAENE
ncbi:DUF6279 family lipoprotein [Pseudoalteromonas ardens]|uniref:Lipoprotein n=1 Tax=Pseudoalteromonas rubra TaxID=43658 RepID=A0A0L0ERF8_9GAMM|nr:DUF6279 family lipoprotein [Pseudoalteromonas sp. R96]KNC66994.1 hypothetical protein AC626_13520 [Pseudoalteromonas rubra]MDK1311248.1 DUF6279 family lipoprotein [Pseudoalteromonas sp. R96]